MIDGLDDVVHLCRFKGCGDAVLAVGLLDCFLCQPVTCHAVGGVGEIDLDVLINTVMVVAAALGNDLPGEGRERHCLLLLLLRWFSLGFVCIFRNHPNASNELCFRDPFLYAKLADRTLGETPFFGIFLNCQLFHGCFARFDRKEANAAEQIHLSAERSYASNANIIDAKLPGPGCIL